MKTNTISSLMIEIQPQACNLHTKFAVFCTTYYQRHGIEIFSDNLLPLALTVLIWKLIFKTFILKPEVRSSREAFLSQNGLIKFY